MGNVCRPSFVGSPLAAITQFWGILDSVSNFQCATPRGLIRWVTVGCNYPLFGHFGFSFKFSMCYPKGAHSLGHRWLQLPTFWAFWIQFLVFNVLPQGGSFVGSPLAAITHFLDISNGFMLELASLICHKKIHESYFCTNLFK